MRKLILTLWLVLAGAAAADEDRIRQTIDEYRRALAERDGETAFQLLDTASRAYYGEVLDKTRYATAEECRSFSILDKFSVLLGRTSLSARDLESFDAEGYFRHAVEQGWVGSVGDNSVQIEHIAIEGAEALVYFRSGDTISPAPYVFKQEGSDWKISIIEMLPVGEATMREHVERVGVVEEDFLFSTVEAAVGVRPTAKTWDPPLKKKR